MHIQGCTSLITIALYLALVGCENSTGTDQVTGDWLIPQDQIFDGGPGKDGIPALTDPDLTGATGATYLADADLVIGVKMGNEVRAYPHPVLDWHEIINDDVNGTQFSITYCPLTGSGIAWNRLINGTPTTFGVSGLLYNTNLIPYDRATNSNWSQMKLQCVNGPLSGTIISTYQIVETTWATWKEMYPQTKVVSSNTGYSRQYGQYPYGNYRTNSSLLFPISNDDTRLPRKERVHGVIVGDKTKVYRINTFSDDIETVNDTFNSVSLVAVGSSGKNFIVIYERQLGDGTVLTFSPVQSVLPVAMVDNEGTRWDVFGKAVDGPRAGSKLEPMRSYTAYWFAWGAFFPDAEIY
ncbi:MAG: DUF3179 domain-containing protein [Ignavibacteria bacterium]|nr:DUF3179 domain-containing protein [Ignavibacteria bacterium]